MVARFGKRLVESGFSSIAKSRKNLAYPTKLDAKLDKLKTDISSKEDNLKTLLKEELISKNKYQTLLDAYKKPRQKKIFKLQDQIAARAKEMERTGKVQTTRNNPRLAAEMERINQKNKKKEGSITKAYKEGLITKGEANNKIKKAVEEGLITRGEATEQAKRLTAKKGGRLRGMGKALRGGGKVMRG